MARRKARRCRFGKVKTGPRKGRCRKRALSGAAKRGGGKRKRKTTRRRRASTLRGVGATKCRFGRVKSGKRKGLCRKRRVRRRRRYH